MQWTNGALSGVRALAWGGRRAVDLCTEMLAAGGAQITIADAAEILPFDGFDVVVTASDVASKEARDALCHLRAESGLIVCDITAMGVTGARSGVPYSDAEVQAITGLMDTTGFATGSPVHIGVPITEISAGMYAATAIVAALHVWRTRGICQNIDVSLFGCAASALTTFLPKAFVQDSPGRVGNRHPACAPWNAYATRDGWILICTSTEEQWRRLRGAIGDAELEASCFDQLPDRLRHVDKLDARIEAWARTLTTEECSALCERIGIAAGPILTVGDLPDEPNFRLRHPLLASQIAKGPVFPRTYAAMVPFAVHPLRTSGATMGAVDEAHDGTMDHVEWRSGDAPLSGVRVIEIGQYTTAPLVGKHLAALGAEVIKVEPPDGEAARNWPPKQNGLSYFFALNNTDKRAVSLDLKHVDDLERLRLLIRTADVLIENLRPGALAKLGLDRDSLANINPGLIYCSISGFGLTSAYPTRPAFDTVIQAMGGLMARTRSGEVPVKIGASAADVLGGQAALFAIVSTIVAPLGRAGACVEVAMQDVAVWSSLFAAGNAEAAGETISCFDGHVWLTLPHQTAGSIGEMVEVDASTMTREQVIDSLAALGQRAVPVARVDELLNNPDFAIDVLTAGRDDDGHFWPLLNVPYRLAKTPATVRTVPSIQERAPGAVPGNEAHELISAADAALEGSIWPQWQSAANALGERSTSRNLPSKN